MRKRIINSEEAFKNQNNLPDHNWLNIKYLASVEVTSEKENHPIEAALLHDQKSGWQASTQGKQVIRLIFDNPQRIQWIRLFFVENHFSRTQEYVLNYSEDGKTFQELLRQQWNFSPEGAPKEVEDFQVDITDVRTLELVIVPDINNNNAMASIERFWLA